MTTIASQITSLTAVYSTVYSDADQRKHQSSASLAFVPGIHRDRWIPRTKGQLRGKCFHLMTSSCVVFFTGENWGKHEIAPMSMILLRRILDFFSDTGAIVRLSQFRRLTQKNMGQIGPYQITAKPSNCKPGAYFFAVLHIPEDCHTI